LSSEGYPESYDTGFLITGIDSANQLPHCHVIHSGTRDENDACLTNGGRVLTVVAQHDDLETAVEMAYEGLNKINFEGKYFRTDIAYKAFPIVIPGSCDKPNNISV
jgi:phosphoribosylamine--glycine ligase